MQFINQYIDQYIDHLKRLLHRQPRTLPSQQAYAQWAASYPPRAHNALMQAEEDAMLALLPPLDACAVLDLACGTGRYGLHAAKRGARLVVGLDNSRAMLLAAPLGFRVQATSEALPLAGARFDVVLCGLALGHLPGIAPSIREIARVLKPGGTALVSDVHPGVVRSGGQRTFRGSDGKTYAVEHHIHTAETYHAAIESAGLVLDTVQEPAIPAPKSGELIPVVVVYRVRKS